MEEEELSSLDEAVNRCEALYREHDYKATRMLMAIVSIVATVAIGVVIGYKIFMESSLVEISPVVAYVVGVVFVVVFTVLMSQYRFHAVEASRMAQYQLGFMRVRVAGRRASNPGYQSEVRTTLTSGAFDISTAPGFFTKREVHIESPAPGSPASDISAKLLEKLIEKVDVSIKK